MKRCIYDKIKQRKFAQNRRPVQRQKPKYLFESNISVSGNFEEALQDLCRTVIEMECCHQITGNQNHDPLAVISAAAQRRSESNFISVLDYYNQFYEHLRVIEEISLAT